MDNASSRFTQTLQGGLLRADQFLSSRLSHLQAQEISYGTELQALAAGGCGISPETVRQSEEHAEAESERSRQDAVLSFVMQEHPRLKSLCSQAFGAHAESDDERPLVGGGSDPLAADLVLWRVLDWARGEDNFFRREPSRQQSELFREFGKHDSIAAKKQFATALRALRNATPTMSQGTSSFLPYVLTRGEADARAFTSGDDARMRRLREKYLQDGWEAPTWFDLPMLEEEPAFDIMTL